MEINGDFLQVRSAFKNVRAYLDSASLSPSGLRVAVTARGWVMTAPASKGDVHVLNDQQGVFRREATWSPDGRTIAYFTDQTGTMELALYDTTSTKEKLLPLGTGPGVYSTLTWSPDSSKVAYVDQSRTLWYLDVKTAKNVKVSQTVFDDPTHAIVPDWSPDSKWLTWSSDLENHFNAIFVYSLDKAQKTQITDGLADADSPVFDRDGRMLYFVASTQVGQGASWLDISSFNALNAPRSVYAVVLKKDTPNPLQPESDEEVVKPEVNPDAPPSPTPDVPKAPTPTDAKAAAMPAQKAPADAKPAAPPTPPPFKIRNRFRRHRAAHHRPPRACRHLPRTCRGSQWQLLYDYSASAIHDLGLSVRRFDRQVLVRRPAIFALRQRGRHPGNPRRLKGSAYRARRSSNRADDDARKPWPGHGQS